MKLKGINPIEQHVEKIVLALVAMVLLAVLAMQFLTQPNQVNVGARSIPPQNVYVELENQAKALDGQLKDASPALPEVKPTDLVERFDKAMAQASDSATHLSAPLGTGVDVTRLAGVVITGGPGPEKIGSMRVPATSTPIGASQWATLDPYAVLTVPEYAAFVPAQQPYDFASVTIEANFSGTKLRDALSTEEGAGIPRRFWQATGMAILGFEVERQRLMPDGTWSAGEPIVTPPGTPSPTGALAPDAGLPELTELVSKAVGAAPDVQRPTAPPTISGPEWLPPSERLPTDEGTLSAAERLRRKLARAEADLERLQNPPQRPDRTPSGDPYAPGGGKTATPGGGRDREPSSRPSSNERNQKRIEQLRKEIEDLRKQLKDMGEEAPAPGQGGSPLPPRSPDDVRRLTGVPLAQPGSLTLLEQESVQLWAHDLGAEPGATYRYRTRVAVNNPLFRKGPVLDPDDQALQEATKSPYVRGEWSEWSAPVVVGAKEYYFVTNADPEGSLSGGRPGASIEVYRVFYGFYRKSTLNLTPGDSIASSVRMPDGLYTVDAQSVEPKAAAEVFGADKPGSLPTGISQITGRLTIDLGAYVLDVASRPVPVTDNFGKEQVVTEVVVRTKDGSVVARSARADAADPAYQLASSSASQASKASLREPGQPAVSPSAALFPPADAQP